MHLAEGWYRVFAGLERRCGRFAPAYDYRIGAGTAAGAARARRDALRTLPVIVGFVILRSRRI
jgi:hypothetical protein